MKVTVIGGSTTGEVIRDSALYGNLGFQFLVGKYQENYVLSNVDELLTQDDTRAIVEEYRNLDKFKLRNSKMRISNGMLVKVVS